MPIPQCDQQQPHTNYLKKLIPHLEKELDRASLGPWITKNIAPMVETASKDLAIAGRSAGTMEERFASLETGLKGLLAAAYCKGAEGLDGRLATFQNPKKPKKDPKNNPKKNPKKKK